MLAVKRGDLAMYGSGQVRRGLQNVLACLLNVLTILRSFELRL